jgi:hypothetical protein
MGGMAMENMPADASGAGVPPGVAQFAVYPFWPNPLPNNWIVGQVAGLSIDRTNDHVWIIHRPWSAQPVNAGSTPLQTVRDNTWGADPVVSTCCTTAPPVLEFDPEGNVVRSWGAGDGYDWFNSEHGIHVDHNGKVWARKRRRRSPHDEVHPGRSARDHDRRHQREPGQQRHELGARRRDHGVGCR